MLAEKRLRHIFGAIGQQRDSEKVFLLREIDRMFEKPAAVTVTLILRVHHEVLQEHDEPAFGRADGEEQINHPDDCAIAAQHKNPASAGLFENESQSAELFVLIGTEVALVSEQFAEQFRQLVQVGFSRRLDYDIFFLRHCLFCLSQNSEALAISNCHSERSARIPSRYPASRRGILRLRCAPLRMRVLSTYIDNATSASTITALQSGCTRSVHGL